jgi:hypothetical protein
MGSVFLPAAFNALNNTIILNTLQCAFGLQNMALALTKPYLTGQVHSVVANGIKSCVKILVYGFPHGSVLGPKHFMRYSNPMVRLLIRMD